MIRKSKAGALIGLKIKELEVKKKLIDLEIQNITDHLSGRGVMRRIRPCDIDDSDEKECPWKAE